jgi:hypothetical protein
VFELGIILTAEFILEGCDFFYNFSDSEYLSWLPWKPAFATNILQHFPSFLMTTVLIGACVTRYLVLCVCFVDLCLSFCTFSIGYCVVWSSRNTHSDYPFGIFKLFVDNFVYLPFGFLAPKDFYVILRCHLLTLIIDDED